MKILVVIVAYNGLKWLEKCLGSISGADIFVVGTSSVLGPGDLNGNIRRMRRLLAEA